MDEGKDDTGEDRGEDQSGAGEKIVGVPLLACRRGAGE